MASTDVLLFSSPGRSPLSDSCWWRRGVMLNRSRCARAPSFWYRRGAGMRAGPSGRDRPDCPSGSHVIQARRVSGLHHLSQEGTKMTWPPTSNDPEGTEEPDRHESSEFHTHPQDQEPPATNAISIDSIVAGESGVDRSEFVGQLVITDVQVRPVNNNERLRAWVTITFNDAFVIKGIRIIKGHSRLFVAMPSRQQKDGSFQDVAHPINPDFRTYLEETIIGVYLKFTQPAGS